MMQVKQESRVMPEVCTFWTEELLWQLLIQLTKLERIL